MRFELVVDREGHDVEVVRRNGRLLVRVDGAEYRARVRPTSGGVTVFLGGTRRRVEVHGLDVYVDGVRHEVFVPEPSSPVREGSRRARRGRVVHEVRPPMPGRIVKLAIRQGARVRRGQTLVVLEAMKMQNEIPAPADGRVVEVRVAEGESIGAERVIAILETDDGSEARRPPRPRRSPRPG
jgi:pyruvate carboxylase subunit B